MPPIRLVPLAVALFGTAVLAACGGGSSGTTAGSPVGPGAAPPAGDTAGRTDAASEIRVAKSEQHGILYLADATGRALYARREDPNNGTTCYDDCARAFPPLTTSAGTATVRSDVGLQQSQAGTVRRNDGAAQVTFGGHALYYSAADTGPGSTKGQGVKDGTGTWQLVQPNGALPEASAAATPAQPSSAARLPGHG